MRRLSSPRKKELVADTEIARIATLQHGLITAAQLAAALSSSSQIHARVAAGRLHRLHRGVYAVGHVAPSAERRYLAAVLAAGPEAALSHLAAADLWRLWPNTRTPVDVTVPGGGGRAKRPDLRVHRSTTLRPQDVTVLRAIPVTTVPRTLRDVHPLLPPAARLRAAHEALVRHGVRVDPGEPLTLSRLERRLLVVCRKHGLPVPETNVLVEGAQGEHRVDALWRASRLVVEVDGFEVHSSRRAFERDRERSADLEDAGYRVLRVAEAQLRDETTLARRIRDRLAGSA